MYVCMYVNIIEGQLLGPWCKIPTTAAAAPSSSCLVIVIVLQV